ncbi:MAG: hypothetical protein AVDCRST_MAG20-2283 [uncultured Acidimicrobiales bacterium]|uniref:Uncharacterized protein n=1 Tax=uncultured Acidimicrobiales bacterium TaxID=310071 RepID=A0A6J4II89_9ACTN|nr:MAG: hypothetical protein AVDCRST_MAG20-2283 [uncultured Acidimicrobiales bacterium]
MLQWFETTGGPSHVGPAPVDQRSGARGQSMRTRARRRPDPSTAGASGGMIAISSVCGTRRRQW